MNVYTYYIRARKYLTKRSVNEYRVLYLNYQYAACSTRVHLTSSNIHV